MDIDLQIQLYRTMLTAREIDRLELEVTQRGEAFFQVSGAGHEGSVALNPHLRGADFLHCHYRDKALLLARGLSPRDFFDSLYCKRASHSRGRQMSAHMCSRELNVLSIVGPVGNSALQAVGVAAAIRDDPQRPLVLCSVGDGTTQEGEFLEAVGEAVREQLPVLFFIENNRWAISTNTEGKTLFSTPAGSLDSFYGLPVHRLDGRDVVQAHHALEPIVASIRNSRRTEIVVFDVERLSDHTNADDQTIYRRRLEIEHSLAAADPIRILRSRLLARGVCPTRLADIELRVREEVAKAEEQAACGPDPQPILQAKSAIPAELSQRTAERRGNAGELVMRDALRCVLREQLRADNRVTLWGQDIDDPKGDVFGVTKGLGEEFGDRVRNAPLSESTIVGASIGRALVGQHPVAFIQFADFLPLAYNQIISELGSLHWRTDGKWPAPLIIMVPCGAYRPGLGPFHAQSLESIVAHVPGIDVFMPSTAPDAAGLLNAAFRSQRPTIFFYPKSCLNDPEATTSANVSEQFVPIGCGRKTRCGDDLTFVSWGNTVRLCQRAVDALADAGFSCDLIDLRSLSPWDEELVLASAAKTTRLIVVHEDNRTCGLGAEIIATVSEKLRCAINVRRVTRPDTYVPCNFANQIDVLPSFTSILAAAAELLGLELIWQRPEPAASGAAFVEAIGSGPADETVELVELFVGPGDQVQRGDIVAALEATKSVFELTSQISGLVEEVMASAGDQVPVGAPLLKLKVADPRRRAKPITQEQPGTPLLLRKEPWRAKPTFQEKAVAAKAARTATPVGLGAISTALGGLSLTNEALLARGIGRREDRTCVQPEDITRRTGIQQRCWVIEGEDAIGLAVAAARRALHQDQLTPEDVDLVICCTTSPAGVTPSMACRVLSRLCGSSHLSEAQAYDINAACSGYLYALQMAYDFLQSQPNARVLLVTAEVLSPLLDPDDFDTAILFGDAASATVLHGEASFARAWGRLHRPSLSTKRDADESLRVPFSRDGYIEMNGSKVFREAVRAMLSSLDRACQLRDVSLDELRMIVPHQANLRIIEAIRSRVRVDVFSNIHKYGNTSSSSIPLCMDELRSSFAAGDRLGLCAFGGGFTCGATLLEVV